MHMVRNGQQSGVRAAALTRRAALGLGAGGMAFMLAPRLGRAAGAAPKRVAVFDWGLAETLLGLGAQPVTVAETAGYREWVIEPALPEGIADCGLRIEPNFELLAAIRPDLILITPELDPLRASFARIAPTETLAIYTPDGAPWDKAREALTAMARLLGRETDGAALLARVDGTLSAARERIGPAPRPPVLLVNFMDKRHVRIYGRNSIFGAVLERLGLRNAYAGWTSFWGFATLGIEHLAANGDAQLFYFEPIPEEARAAFAERPLWQALPFVRDGRVAALPPVWSFGGMMSAERLARVLGEKLAAGTASSAEARSGQGVRHE
jgi:ABC-type Fe3+-hydroxamate transport system substrate-binding protein